MSVKPNFGGKDIPLVFKGGKLIYPNYAKDGLVLHYDFSGMTNTDANKDIATDLSGNANHGTLQNFNFTEQSGYGKNRLLFDGVDDQLQIPELSLVETGMTVGVDGKVYAYEDDKVVTVKNYSTNVKESVDGIEVGGRNLFLNGGTEKSMTSAGRAATFEFLEEYNGEKNIMKITNPPSYVIFDPAEQYSQQYKEGETYTLTIKAMAGEGTSTVPNMYMGSNSGSYVPADGAIDDSGFKRVSVTKTFSADTSGRAHLDFRDLDVVYLSMEIQSEHGNVSTPWTPAPEDFQTTSLSPSSISNLQLYNRPLLKNELLQNAESDGLKELKDGVVVQDGLVLHYDFSKETNTSEYKGKAFDYSGSGNHGTLNNFNYTVESGYDGNALKFDNVDDFVSPNLSSPEERVTSFTILSTVYFGGARGAMIWGGTPSAFYLRRNAGTSLHGSVYTGDAGQETNSVPNIFGLDEPALMNVGMSLDTNTMIQTFIVNGEIVSEFELRGKESSPFLLTHVGTWPTLDYANLDGSMHSFQMYNRALTPEEIAHNYQIEKEKYGLE